MSSAIADALARVETATIAGCGTFTTRSHPARPGRNPRTGGRIAIAVSTAPSFKVGKTLRDGQVATDVRAYLAATAGCGPARPHVPKSLMSPVGPVVPLVAGRRRPASRRFTKRANMCADHARTFDPSGATTHYRGRCELVPTTLVLTRAQAPYRKRFRAAYAPHRSRAVAPCRQFPKRSPAAHTDPHRGPALTFTITIGAREETCALPRHDTRSNRCVRASTHEMSPVSAVSLTRDGSFIRGQRCMSLNASYFPTASQRLTAPVAHNPDHRPRQSTTKSPTPSTVRTLESETALKNVLSVHFPQLGSPLPQGPGPKHMSRTPTFDKLIPLPTVKRITTHSSPSPDVQSSELYKTPHYGVVDPCSL